MSLGYTVRPNAPSADPDLVAALQACDAADISDVMRHSRTMVGLTPLWDHPTFAGPAVTVSLPIGGLTLQRLAMDMCRPGDVLVIAARGLPFAWFGGKVAQALRNRGLAGLVIDGMIRDADEIREAGLPVASRGVFAVPPAREAAGEINVPVACAGAVVNPGDIVVGNANGVVAVPPEHGPAILDAVALLQQKFASWGDDVTAGRTPGMDGIRELLLQNGCDLPPADAVQV